MCMLLIAKKHLYNSPLFRQLVPFRQILKNTSDPNFWADEKNYPFIELLDKTRERVAATYYKHLSRKEILKSNLDSLYLLQGNIKKIHPYIKELERDFINPIEELLEKR